MKQQMKRILALVLALVLALTLSVGCGGLIHTQKTKAETMKEVKSTSPNVEEAFTSTLKPYTFWQPRTARSIKSLSTIR